MTRRAGYRALGARLVFGASVEGYPWAAATPKDDAQHRQTGAPHPRNLADQEPGAGFPARTANSDLWGGDQSAFHPSLPYADFFEDDGVKYATPKYDRSTVNKAGEQLRKNMATSSDFEVIGNWRSSHSYPLFKFRTTLQRRGLCVNSKILISQRLKRLSSIVAKLARFRNLRLGTIQDIGGCRAVLSSEKRARALFDRYLEGRSFSHELLWSDNYVDNPKDSGYRGFHLIYAYEGRYPIYDGLRIEIQIRSRYQHAWATAVETVDIFTRQALKSNIGSDDWKEFFRLVSSYIAMREKKPLVPGTPTLKIDLKNQISELTQRLRVFDRLNDFRNITEDFDKEKMRSVIHEKAPRYFLLEVQPQENRIYVTAYNKKHLDSAQSHYLSVEQNILNSHGTADAVLVSVDRMVNLRKAFPNYYGDTDLFLTILRDAVS